MIAEEANLGHSTTRKNWIVDMRATAHVSYDRGDPIQQTGFETQRVVRFSGSETGSGIGIVQVETIADLGHERGEIILDEVAHVPRLTNKHWNP